MPIRISSGYQEQFVAQVMTELAAKKARDEGATNSFQSDICDWAEEHFYIPALDAPIRLPLHQKAVLRFMFTRRENGHFAWQNYVYSTIKKSGKSTTAGLIARWFAETQTRYGEIYAIGNDLEQAKDRSFKEVRRSLELTPGYRQEKDLLPGRWSLQKTAMRCLMNGSTIKAIAVDAKGEAGGQQAMTIWTELWGAENEDAKRFWDEMPPINTVSDSLRVVETYAGYDGESELLRGLYDRGQEGHQMSAGELASFVCRPGVPGEEYQDYVNAWHETDGDPEVLIPVWYNDIASLCMYWDEGLRARRMPWQHMFEPLGEEGEDDQFLCKKCRRLRSEHEASGLTADQYYAAEEEAARSPQAFRRLHLNEWVGAESSFVPMESWDACGYEHDNRGWPRITILQDGERTPIVVSADAAVTGDCFGIVAVQRCSMDPTCVDLRALRKWDPAESGGTVNLEEPEAFIRGVAKLNNIMQCCYDPYQMESMAQRLRRDSVVWMAPFNQAGDRLKADSALYDMVVGRRIHFSHAEDCPCDDKMVSPDRCNCMIRHMREHIGNSNSKVQVNEDSKIRIVKKASGKKIDLCVSLSMAAARCLYLRLG
jgi:hypothetical protein